MIIIIWKGLIYQDFDYSEKYVISEFGDVRNIQTGNILKPSINRGGYKYVCISLHLADGNGQRKTIIIHKAVAYTYLNNPNGYVSVDHIDCNKINNHYSNLEWVTMSENFNRACKNGLIKSIPGDFNVFKKLTTDDVLRIRELLSTTDYSQSKIAAMFGVNRSNISQIKNRKTYKYI